MQVLKLLAEARAAGLIVWRDGDSVCVRQPKHVRALLDKLRERKPELLAALRGEGVEYAACDADAEAGRPTYHPDNDPLPQRGDLRAAWVDVMVLQFAALHRARHAAEHSPCPRAIAEPVRADAGAVARRAADEGTRRRPARPYPRSLLP